MTDRSISLAERITAFPISGPSTSGDARVAEFASSLSGLGAEHLAAMLQQSRVRRLFSGIADGSPYLWGLAIRDPRRTERMLATSPEEEFQRATAKFTVAMATVLDEATAKRCARRYKSTVALLTALADLGGVWPVMTVTRRLSEAADAAVNEGVRFLLRRAAVQGSWAPGNATLAEQDSGYFVLAMGKHGAFELNYSSDIDLIVLFDRDRARFTGRGDLQSFFVRLTRDLVSYLDERTSDGYVFRTDLRLRPDSGATQLALSTAAAHDYYETVGQNWERAAMIKARVCAGDIDAGTRFLAELAPFVWRKYLDFAAIADVHAMKRQINLHHGHGDVGLLGQNIKLGRGGIREIEFFAQTQQLIAGGRQPDLRVPATLAALDALARRGWVTHQVVVELAESYRFLRRLEHRIQMVADEQTHDLPLDIASFDRLARFCGESDPAMFSAEIVDCLMTVARHYAGLFEGGAELAAKGTNMVFAGEADDPATIEHLERLGYTNPTQVIAMVRGWHHGRTRAVRSPTARERLTEVQPVLIAALADTVDPDGAMIAFDRFLSELPAGVQLFSLLIANPALLRLIADIMGTAPRLARILSRRRRLLDGVLDPKVLTSEIDGPTFGRLLADEIAAARPAGEAAHQVVLDRARVVVNEQKFLIGAGLLTGNVSAPAAGRAFATLAECAVAAMLADVTAVMEEAHGRLQGGEAVVVAMGKLGGREMTASSDVDLILIYDFDALAEASDGAKPLAPSHYYSRLTTRLITALAAPTSEGTLYDVDMRLRPSGQKGPVATRLSSFAAYHETDAWTWEHMALTRARVVAGSPSLWEKTSFVIRTILARPRDRAAIATDVRDMRRRIATEKGSDSIWDLKQVRGGLVDLEFIAQHLQLVTAASEPSVLDTNTLGALRRLADCGQIEHELWLGLDAAGQALGALTAINRLCLETPFDPQTAPEGLKRLLARGCGKAGFGDLETDLRAHQRLIYRAFEDLVA